AGRDRRRADGPAGRTGRRARRPATGARSGRAAGARGGLPAPGVAAPGAGPAQPGLVLRALVRPGRAPARSTRTLTYERFRPDPADLLGPGDRPFRPGRVHRRTARRRRTPLRPAAARRRARPRLHCPLWTVAGRVAPADARRRAVDSAGVRTLRPGGPSGVPRGRGTPDGRPAPSGAGTQLMWYGSVVAELAQRLTVVDVNGAGN